MEKWDALFPNGNPDAHRDAVSQTSDAITNPLSDVSGLDNKYTSLSTLPTGRQSQAISVLWANWCGVGGDSDASINHLTTNFGAAQQSQGSNSHKRKLMISAMKKNVTVRSAIDAVAATTPTSQDGSGGTAAQAAVIHATVKGNYRLGAVNPDGIFSNFTGKPMTNGGDDIATISLQRYRDGMG